MATSKSLVPQAFQQFTDSNGVPLAGGSVVFYVPNTTTLANIWQDPVGATAAPNPVTLDAAGRPSSGGAEVSIYGSSQMTQVVKDVNGQTVWSGLVQDPLSLASGAIPTALIQGFLAGLGMTWVAGGASVNFGAGAAGDSTNTVIMSLAAWNKSIAGAFAAGSGQNGLGTGVARAQNTWYHVFLVLVGGTADIYFDTSVTAANAPAGTTAFRRIGSVLTDVSTPAVIIRFVQNGDEFIWYDPVADANSVTVGTSAVLVTLTVPIGVLVDAMFHGVANNAGGIANIVFTSPSENDPAVSTYDRSLSTPAASISISGDFRKMTNTSGQIRVRADTATTLVFIGTYGWFDSRGRFA